jgi:hypothetical protein
MKRYRIGCLPVLQDAHIVALLTEEDFVGLASRLVEEEQEAARLAEAKK